jgi:hypothetical protein
VMDRVLTGRTGVATVVTCGKCWSHTSYVMMISSLG